MIIIDKIIKASATSGTTVSFNIPIDNQNQIIVVTTNIVNNGSSTPGAPTLTYNGVSFAANISKTVAGSATAIFLITAPIVGIKGAIITTTGTNQLLSTTTFVISGVNKRTKTPYVLSGSSSSSSITLNISPGDTNALVIASAGLGDQGSSGNVTVTGGITQVTREAGAALTLSNVGIFYSERTQTSIKWSESVNNIPGCTACAIALEPDQAPSIFFPNVQIRNQKDILQANNLQNGVTVQNTNYGYFPSQFFQNSFLHTIGRMIHPPSAQAVAKSVNGLFNSSRIIIDHITQSANTGASTLTVDHSVYSADSVLVIFASLAGLGASLSSTTLNGQVITSLATDTVSTLVGGLYFVINPRVGVNTITVTSGVSAALQIIAISLLGVDKKTSNPIFVSANGATGSPSSIITPTASNSLIIDFVGTLLGNGTPDASQYQYFQQPQSTSGAFGSIKLAGTSAQTMSWATTGAAWTQLIIALEPAQAASLWNPNIDLRSILDVIGPAGMNTEINPTGNYAQVNGYHPSTYWQNSFLHTVGRIQSQNKKMRGSTLLLMGVG